MPIFKPIQNIICIILKRWHKKTSFLRTSQCAVFLPFYMVKLHCIDTAFRRLLRTGNGPSPPLRDIPVKSRWVLSKVIIKIIEFTLKSNERLKRKRNCFPEMKKGFFLPVNSSFWYCQLGKLKFVVGPVLYSYPYCILITNQIKSK